jgi:hypothetical protein
MPIQQGDRRGEFIAVCNTCGRELPLRKGDLVLAAPPRLSSRVTWRQDGDRTFCPKHDGDV